MRTPNCVPEYYRELQEREDHEYEKTHRFDAYYEESKRRLQEALDNGYPVLNFCGYPQCYNCEKKFDIQIDTDDDLCSLICYDKNCECHKSERR